MEYLDYIESQGNCYFDMGVNANSNIVIQFKARIMASTGDAFIGKTFDRDNASLRFFVYNWSFYLDYGNGNTWRLNGGEVNSEKDYELEIGNRYLKYINGDTILTGNAVSFDYSSYNSKLTLLQNAEKGRIYYCKVFESGTLIRDFIPVVNDEGKVGLFDKVSKEFFENIGTGNLTYGKIIPKSKYLIRQNEKIYTITDGELTELEGATLNASLFIADGVYTIDSSILGAIQGVYDVLCYNEDSLPADVIHVLGTAADAQELISNDIPVGDKSIYGIESIEIDAAETTKFLFSFDNSDYKVYNSSSETWEVSQEGATAAEVVAIPTTAWSAAINSIDNMKVKAILQDTDTLTQFKINFNNTRPI